MSLLHAIPVEIGNIDLFWVMSDGPCNNCVYSSSYSMDPGSHHSCADKYFGESLTSLYCECRRCDSFAKHYFKADDRRPPICSYCDNGRCPKDA